jgi:hypothetical protein
VDRFIGQVRALNTPGQTGGSRVFRVRRHLVKEAGRELDRLFGHLQLLKHPSHPQAEAEQSALESEVARVLNTPANWQPDLLGVMEQEARTEERGFDGGVSLRARKQVAGNNRYLAVLRPGVPGP